VEIARQLVRPRIELAVAQLLLLKHDSNSVRTLVHLLLNHVMPNFDVEDEMQASLLKMIFLYEQTLVENGVLGSDFCYAVARPLDASPASGSDAS